MTHLEPPACGPSAVNTSFIVKRPPQVKICCVARRIRDAVFPVPLWLAGGLRSHSVTQAITTAQPFGLDLCTGVRSNGQLDDRKLAAFVAAVSAAAERDPPAANVR